MIETMMDLYPKCCRSCVYFEDWEQVSCGEIVASGYYCGLGLKFPTRKKTCKRQEAK